MTVLHSFPAVPVHCDFFWSWNASARAMATQDSRSISDVEDSQHPNSKGEGMQFACTTCIISSYVVVIYGAGHAAGARALRLSHSSQHLSGLLQISRLSPGIKTGLWLSPPVPSTALDVTPRSRILHGVVDLGYISDLLFTHMYMCMYISAP